MQRTTRRWLLSPITQWHAMRLSARHGKGIDVQTAWLLIRLRRNPAEAEYALAAGGLPKSANPGVHYDDWTSLPSEERNHRISWLARHGRSPFQQLEITEEFLIRAGIEVTDWGPIPTGPS